MTKNDAGCVCGFGEPYVEHCEKIHMNGAGLGATAEALMRARYAAYVMHDRGFLQASWHLDTRPAAIQFDDSIEWLGLEIVDTEAGGAFDSTGVVEFRARFLRNQEPLELHERSSFVRVDGRWMYVDGV